MTLRFCCCIISYHESDRKKPTYTSQPPAVHDSVAVEYGRCADQMDIITASCDSRHAKCDRGSGPSSFLQAFGKAFLPLLLFDVVVGVIAFEETRQRVFSHLSKSIVVHAVQPHHRLDVKYLK